MIAVAGLMRIIDMAGRVHLPFSFAGIEIVPRALGCR